MRTLKVLIVDDENFEGVLIERCVDWAAHGFRIVGSAQNAQDALAIFRRESPDVVLCDVNMPVMNGLELSRRMKALDPDVRIIIVTGYREFSYAKAAIEIGVENYILKPIQAEELLRTAEKIRSEFRRVQENAAPRENAAPGAGTPPGDGAVSVRNALIHKTVEYIECNLSTRGLSLRTIAPAVYVNGSYLSRIFRDELGETISEYILRRRMEKSRELFETTDLRVYEVAALVGLTDAHYFGQCFKKYFGRTVNEYRQESRVSGGSGPA